MASREGYKWWNMKNCVFKITDKNKVKIYTKINI